MRFNLETSKLVYEVRYQREDSEESYTFEQLYRDIQGRYFIHFEGGKYSAYSVKTGYCNYAGRNGNYYINIDESDVWKRVSEIMKQRYPDRYEIIDWEKEENEYLVWMGMIAEEELPF